ncbi:nuclear transport factor 2 family protein [Sphingosinicella soli]|uniref:Ketosteroid isomerase-like protein n=1 Tax=Sphingosinicella soli TaxID=333708 RepID=A0A7W7F7V7_9SPHN|nr:nuclear transport factor 2 family protein [Sphingosinicella soli]MBB4633861.1 ketosteroid isomerase-like protein [Sphingosinicella soli]
MSDSMAQMDELVSRARITDLLLLYCRALDRCDVPLMKSLYWEDAIDNHGVFNGGAQAFAEYIVGDTKQRFESTVHALSNILIELEGDTAFAESYLIANCVLKGDRAKVEDTFGPTYAARFDWDEIAGIPHEFFFGGRYFDRLERRGGEWRIAERMLLMDWNHCDIGKSIFTEGMLAHLRPLGRRHPDDALYHFRKGPAAA